MPNIKSAKKRGQFVLLQRKSTRQLPREFFTRTLLQEASLISRSALTLPRKSNHDTIKAEIFLCFFCFSVDFL